MIVAGRGARRLLNAAMSGAIAVLSIAVLSIAVLGVAVLGVAVLGVAGPVAAAHPAAAYPRPQLTEPQVDPTPEPTPTDLPTTPPPPPPPPPPAPGVKINAADVTLGPSYWQGSVTKGAMTVQVTNTGDSAELVTLIVDGEVRGSAHDVVAAHAALRLDGAVIPIYGASAFET